MGGLALRISMLLAIPLVGWTVSSLLLAGPGSAGFLGLLAWLQIVSVGVGIAPLALLAVQASVVSWAGYRREALARVITPLTQATIFASAAIVFGQALIVLGLLVVVVAKSTLAFLIGAGAVVFIGGLVAAAVLVQTGLRAGEPVVMELAAKRLSREGQPKLHAHVALLAQRLGARPPDHLVVGFSPSFFATAAELRLDDDPEPLQGETLHLSLPLTRVFTPAELDAVIGHELGHFRGSDTVYSIRFAPAFLRLSGAFGGLIDVRGRTAWLALPALVLLSFLQDRLALAEAAVSREREFEADRAGMEVAGAEASATALLKHALYADGWYAASNDADFLHPEADDGNLSDAFIHWLRGFCTPDFLASHLKDALDGETPHPIDSHPPIGARLSNMGVDPQAVDPERLAPSEGLGAAILIQDLQGLEVQLSNLERNLRARPAALPEGSVLARISEGI